MVKDNESGDNMTMPKGSKKKMKKMMDKNKTVSIKNMRCKKCPPPGKDMCNC